MVRNVILDGDGVAILRVNRFSDRLASDFGIRPEVTRPFFRDKYPACRVGKADLKTELAAYYKGWGWKGTLDELLNYWFTKEGALNEPMLETVAALRKEGVRVFLSTDNEKYRTDYITNEFGMGARFDGILSSAYIGHSKAELEFWRYIREKGVAQPDESLVWDDEIENIESAKAEGFTALLYDGMAGFNRAINAYFPDIS